MPSRWNFRKILDVDPENNRLCAGWAPSKGRECWKPISKPDRATAGRLLDDMDHAKRLLDSLDDLEILARLLLCKSLHDYSQAREVTQKWTAVVIKEDERIKRKSAQLLQAQRELAKMSSNIQVMVEAVEEAVETPPKTKIAKPSKRAETVPAQAQRSTISVYRDDPFTDSPNASAARTKTPNQILSAKSTNAPMSFKAPPATAVKPLSASIFPSVPTKLPIEKNTQHISSSPTKASRDVSTDNTMEASLVLENPIESQPMKEILLESSRASYNYKDELKLGMTDVVQVRTTLLQPQSTNSDEYRPPSSSFEFRSQERMPNIELAALKQTPLGKFNLSGHTEAPKNTISSSIPEFGKGTAQSTFDFGSPWNFQQISQPPVTDTQLTLENQEESSVCDNDKEDTYPSTPVKSSVNIKDAEPTTPPEDASHGYALITPPSTSYITHLPATQHQMHAKLQNGLFTPPETPESIQVPKMQADLPSSPRSEPIDIHLPQPLSHSKSPSITRKPVPFPSSTEEEITEKTGEVVVSCSSCGNGKDTCHCGASEPEEVVVKSGCFSRLTNRWRRMKQKATNRAEKD